MQSAKTHSLLLSRSPWSAILEQYPFPASLTNARHAYLYINPAFERFYGLKLADVVGLTPWILMPRQSGVEEVKKMRRRLKANGEIWQGTFDNLNAAGKCVRVHVMALSLSGVPQGAPAAYLSVAGLEKDAPGCCPRWPGYSANTGSPRLRRLTFRSGKQPRGANGRTRSID